VKIDWGRMGFIYGTVFQNLFELPENYLPVNEVAIDERT